MTAEAIVAEALTRRYGDLVAVGHVSLTVGPGEVVGLLGPNGAGKTTLLRMLAGVLAPSEGRASILGFDVVDDPLEAKSRLGFLSGDTALYARLTVTETLRYFGRLHDLEPALLAERIAAITEELGLQEILDRRCGELSSGQKQRANLARAFLADPPVLILDEPTTALDVISGRFVHDAIRRAKAAGKAVLLSTHIMSEAESLCDRIALIVHGRLAAVDDLSTLLSRLEANTLTDLILKLHEGEP